MVQLIQRWNTCSLLWEIPVKSVIRFDFADVALKAVKVTERGLSRDCMNAHDKWE